MLRDGVVHYSEALQARIYSRVLVTVVYKEGSVCLSAKSNECGWKWLEWVSPLVFGEAPEVTGSTALKRIIGKKTPISAFNECLNLLSSV